MRVSTGGANPVARGEQQPKSVRACVGAIACGATTRGDRYKEEAAKMLARQKMDGYPG